MNITDTWPTTPIPDSLPINAPLTYAPGNPSDYPQFSKDTEVKSLLLKTKQKKKAFWAR